MNYENVPAEMKTADRWCLWKYERREEGKKPTKVPCDAVGLRVDVAKNPQPLSFVSALDAYLANDKILAGLGFILGDGWAGTDFDGCMHDGIVHPDAQTTIAALDSYSEISPSGTGVKVFLRANMPNGDHGRNKRDVCGSTKVEMYDGARFFTVTGDLLAGAPATANERQPEFTALYKQLFPEPEAPTVEAPRDYSEWQAVPDEQIIKQLHGELRYLKLWNGSDVVDRSEADFALCCRLAYYTGGDVERIDRLFRLSKLWRPKWDERRSGGTYGSETIRKAVAQQKEFWQVRADGGCEFEKFSDVVIEKVEWEWKNRIARRKLNLFVGDPENAKSMCSTDIAARISKELNFPDGEKSELGDTLIVSCEDGKGDTIAPRLLAAGADMGRIYHLKSVKVALPDGKLGESFFNLERDLKKLEAALRKHPSIRLIIVDPLTAYLGKVKSHVDAEVRSVLGPFADMAQRNGVTIIGIMHLRKAEIAALLRVSGSVAFVAAARVVWGFGPDPNDPTRRVMVAVKNNLAPKATPIAYRIKGWDQDPDIGVIEWLPDQQVDLSADDVLASAPKKNRSSALAEAKEWLKEFLSNGPMPQKEVEAAAEAEELSWITVRRAKDALGIESIRTHFTAPWFWTLPVRR